MTSVPSYPPYGHMISEWEKLAAKHEPPAHWDSNVEYNRWREAIVVLLGTLLWPRHLPQEQTWSGAATGSMHDLTLADFRLFPSLRPMIDSDSGIGDGSKHLELFQVEDEQDVRDDAGTIIKDLNVDATLRKYLAGHASPYHVDALAAGYIKGLAEKCGTVDLELKIEMQRPRPLQMSWILGIPFSHLCAKSALTPSLISGHCYELMMGALAAHARADEFGCSAEAFDAIARHAVDVGDRRVYAGVHYPSDNISSWIAGFLTCPHVRVDATARTWLWEAVTTKSHVFQAIETAIASGNGGPFIEPMDLLRALGRGDIITVDEALEYAGERTEAAA